MDAIFVYFCGLQSSWRFYTTRMRCFAVSMLLRFSRQFSICVEFCFTAEVQRSMLASMLGFMKKTKHIRNNELDGSIYLSQLDADGLDPEIARLYLPHCDCSDAYKAEGKFHVYFRSCWQTRALIGRWKRYASRCRCLTFFLWHKWVIFADLKYSQVMVI